MEFWPVIMDKDAVGIFAMGAEPYTIIGSASAAGIRESKRQLESSQPWGNWLLADLMTGEPDPLQRLCQGVD